MGAKRSTKKTSSTRSATTRSKRARSATASAADTPPPLVLLRTAGEDIAHADGAERRIVRLSADWGYTLRMRSRWAHDPDLRAAIGEYALEAMKELGFTDAQVRRLAQCQQLQVVLADHSYGPEVLAAAAAFPWEYVLSAATRCVGRPHGVLITRCLAGAHVAHAPSFAEPSLTIVTSAPGRIGDIYGFDSEVRRLAHAVGAENEDALVFPAADPARPAIAPRATRSALGAYMTARAAARTTAKARPTAHFVHVSGVDPIQAAALVPDLYDAPHLLAPGGMLFARETTPGADVASRSDGSPVAAPREEVVGARALAESLIPDGFTPALVTLNLHYSAAETALEMMRRGALASLGFVDTIPDEVAEYFFTVFYAECRAARSLAGIADAFGRAWDQLSDQGHDLHGTGIVLWLCTCDPAEPEPATAARTRTRAVAAEAAPASSTAAVVSAGAATLPSRIADALTVDVVVPPEINYSLLHNQRSAIRTLTLSKLVDHALDDVRVEVELEAGGVVQQYRRTLTLDEPYAALADAVTLPLTAPLLRSLHERLHTTVYTRVTCQGRVAHEDTHRVALLPVDEWYDDSQNNPWLPSFVLPRDPAVARIISEARKYLIALTDDPVAGFDGYQQVDDPEGGEPATDRTDLQVQAIWTAVMNDRKLLYINPPPTYSRGGQRLRTPSEMLDTSSGTCIDLSLLLAACLEYVEIHACLVLLTGHCFVGYWRADAFQEEFMTVARPPSGRRQTLGEAAFRSGRIELVDRYGWRVGPQGYDEVQEYVRAGALVPLEATGLCFGYPFAQAMEEGLLNLADRNAFDSLLDLRVARRSSPPVTPLPILAPVR